MFGATSPSERNREADRQRSKAEWGSRSADILFWAHSHSLFVHLPQIFSPLSHSLLTLLSIICGPIWYCPPSSHPPHQPPHRCGMGCYTSAVLTLTAPSLWRLISCSDTLSLCHANGPAYLAACVYAISTLSKALENRESQIRETYTHTAWIMHVWTTERERDNMCIWERERGVKRSTTKVLKADYKWEGERACLGGNESN